MLYSVIVISVSFILNLLSFGVNLSFGLMFSEMLDYFNEGKGDTSWIASLNTSAMFLSGPVIGIIIERIGYRWASILGSVLAAAGMACSFLVNSMFSLYLTYGIITGFGFGIVNFVSVAIVNLHFDKRRSLAMGIASTGGGIGPVLFPLLLEKCLQHYGWRGSFLILSGLCLQGVMFGALFRLPKTKISPNTQSNRNCSTSGSRNEVRNHKFLNHNRNKETYKSQALSFYNQCLSLIKKIKFSMFVLGNAVIGMTIQLPHLMLPDLTMEKGMEIHKAVMVVTTTGISGIFGRFLIGCLADRKSVNRFLLMGLIAIAAGGATIPCGLMKSFPVFVGYAVLFGIFAATCSVLEPLLLVDVAGKENVGPALSILYFTLGILKLIGIPIAGWIADWTGSYNGTFYFAGAVFICGGIIICCIPVFMKYTHQKNMNIFHVTVS